MRWSLIFFLPGRRLWRACHRLSLLGWLLWTIWSSCTILGYDLRRLTLCNTRRLLACAWTARRSCHSIHALAQLLIPLSVLDALYLSLQLLVAILLGLDLVQHLAAIRRVELLDELGHQVGVLERVLNAGQHRAGGLALLGVSAILRRTVAMLFDLYLSPQALKVEAAQGLWA